MRLTERVREFIPKAGCCILKRTVCKANDPAVKWKIFRNWKSPGQIEVTVISCSLVGHIAWHNLQPIIK